MCNKIYRNYKHTCLSQCNFAMILSKQNENKDTQVRSFILSNAENEIISSTIDACKNVTLTWKQTDIWNKNWMNMPRNITLGRKIAAWNCVLTVSSYKFGGLAVSPSPIGWQSFATFSVVFRILALSTWVMHEVWRWFITVRGCRLATVGVKASTNLKWLNVDGVTHLNEKYLGL